jgi:hypothetical protein
LKVRALQSGRQAISSTTQHKPPSPDIVREIALLRLIIAALGERATPPWWKTQFLTEVGMRSMNRIFPRTALSAALHSVAIAARDDHDKRIGVGGRYHLFRLPTSIEHSVASALSEESISSDASSIMKEGRDGLIKALEVWANERAVRATDGPITLGKSENLAKAAVIQELAALYLDSFRAGRRVFPYFQDSEGRT